MFLLKKRRTDVLIKRFSLKNLRLQNIIFYAIAAYIVVMIVVQQGSMDTHRKRYEDAVKERQAAEQYHAELVEKQEHIGSVEHKKEQAKESGYISNNEIYFDFEYESN